MDGEALRNRLTAAQVVLSNIPVGDEHATASQLQCDVVVHEIGMVPKLLVMDATSLSTLATTVRWSSQQHLETVLLALQRKVVADVGRQNFTQWINYGTDTFWQYMSQRPDLAIDLATHLNCELGLRKANEWTVQKIVIIVLIARYGDAAATLPLVTVEETITATRKAIKRYRSAKSVGVPSLPDSPAHFQQQHPTIFDRLYNNTAGPVSCPYSSMEIARVGGLVPVRLSQNMRAHATISNTGPAAPNTALAQQASQVPTMMQMMQHMQQQLQLQLQQHVQQVQQQVQQQQVQEPKITIFRQGGVAAPGPQQGGVGPNDEQNNVAGAVVQHAGNAAPHTAHDDPLLGLIQSPDGDGNVSGNAEKLPRDSPHDTAMKIRNALMQDKAKGAAPKGVMKAMRIPTAKASVAKAKGAKTKGVMKAMPAAKAKAKAPKAKGANTKGVMKAMPKAKAKTKGQMVSNEKTRSQVKAWTGKLGPGQYAIFKYKTDKEQVAAVAAARAWLASK